MTTAGQISSILDSLKAQKIDIIDVKDQSDEFEAIIIATGTSSRHNHALMQNCIELMKKQHCVSPNHFERDDNNEWILIDYDSVVVHLLQAETRDFYELEKLWSPISGHQYEVN